MPIRTDDPFQNSLTHLRSDVNRYLDVLLNSGDGREGGLPLLHGPALRPWPGRWRSSFAGRMTLAPEKLVLEIGSHFGEVILQMAQQHPETAFLGLDITFKRVVKLAQKAQQRELPNLTSLLANARGLDQLFADSELDGVVIFFPDPWAKKARQAKHRLLNPAFLDILARKLRPGGFLWFKTDCEPYFEEVALHLDQLGWQLMQPRGLSAQNYTSRFERLFQDQGLPTYALVGHPPLVSARPEPLV